MKIQAEHLWPLILHFVEEYFGPDDLAHFKEYFSLKIEHQDDPLVTAGGIKAILATYLKHNKPVYKKFKRSVEAGDDRPSKKRKRSQSSASKVSEPPKKRRRTSSVASDSSIRLSKKVELPPPETIKPVLFARIDPTKF
jgi:hypothetical protein